MRRVLVTRPEPGASRTARLLKALGLVPLVLPLSEIRGLAVDLLKAMSEKPGAVAVTSANAVRHVPPQLARALSRTPCFAVGETTAALARAAGFAGVVDGPGDADGLARQVIASGMTAPVLYLCGRVRRPAFEEQLAKAGIRVIAVETYDTIRTAHKNARVSAILGGQAADAALLYSAETAAAFLELAGRTALAPLFEATALCCLSPRIAGAVRGKHAGKILVATEPTEAALLSLLGGPG